LPSTSCSASRAIDAGEGFLVHDGLQTVAQRDAAQHGHHQLIVVDTEVGFLE
jgi:hypothetical protein